MKNQLVLWVLAIAAGLTFQACDSNGTENPCEVDFDQSVLFQNMAYNHIIPAFSALHATATQLEAAAQAFVAQPDETKLADLRTAWKAAYLDFQAASPYNFGPAEAVFFRASLNNFPLNVEETQSRIFNQDYTFGNPDDYTQGFPALDYLLFGLAPDAAGTMARFTTDTAATRYQAYLTAVTADIQARSETVYNEWNTGEYLNTFLTNTGTAAGTSLSLLVNHFNEHYEIIKRERVGIASGVLTLGFTNPDKVEAYYSGESLAMLEAAVAASKRAFTGENPSAGTTTGLDDYLAATGATKNGQPLHEAILAQYAAAESAIAALSGRLSDEVEQNNAAVVTAYNELTKQLVNIKTDMPSVMCISITYVDNPSDSD